MTHEEKQKEDLVAYRLDKLEDAVAVLTSLKDVVLKWDSKFSSTEGLFNCPLHTERMAMLNKRMDNTEADVSELKRFYYKSMGALVVISILVQLAGPFFFNRMTGSENVVVSHGHTTVTNVLSPDGLPMTIGPH